MSPRDGARPRAPQPILRRSLPAALGVLALLVGAGIALAAPPPRTHLIGKPTWVRGVTITEYYPIPERFFRGALVRAPGIPGRHRVDWLYSARGVVMEGDGYGLDGQRYHLESVGRGGWVNKQGRRSCVCAGVYWRAGGFWRNRRRGVTFPLQSGGWDNGRGGRFTPLPGATFAQGPSLPLKFYESLAVDLRLIPRGSRVYLPAYKSINGGWFRAADTGSAINGRHVDVYRPPPASLSDEGRFFSDQRMYVIPPKRPTR